MPRSPYLPAEEDEDPVIVFDDTLGSDLRAQRRQRRQAVIELAVTVGGALLIAGLCALILLKW